MKNEITLKARAIRYLSIREYSVKELKQKLTPFVGETDDLPTLLEWLQLQGFLSESRFVETYVRRRAAHYGNARILRELQEHGISDVVLHHAKSVGLENELDRARQIWLKKFGQKSSNAKERARQIRFLQQRGFSSEIIRQVMKQEPLSD